MDLVHTHYLQNYFEGFALQTLHLQSFPFQKYDHHQILDYHHNLDQNQIHYQCFLQIMTHLQNHHVLTHLQNHLILTHLQNLQRLTLVLTLHQSLIETYSNSMLLIPSQ
jgi:hypothetical protein